MINLLCGATLPSAHVPGDSTGMLWLCQCGQLSSASPPGTWVEEPNNPIGSAPHPSHVTHAEPQAARWEF